jgi:hypothetical protein
MRTTALAHSDTHIHLRLLLALVLAPALLSALPRPALAQAPPGDIYVPPDGQVVAGDTYGDRFRSGHVSVVSEFQLSLTGGEIVTIETANVSEGGDPVLHLIEAQGGKEIAVDDNSAGGTSPRVVYRPNEDKSVIVILRSRNPDGAGTADLLNNGEAWKTGVPFAGWHNSYSGLLTGEQLRTVQQPNGSSGYHRIYVLKADGLGLEKRASGGSAAGATGVHIDSDFGQRTVIVGVASEAAAGQARLLRNDAVTDTDFDGLGDGLEAALGTCSALSGHVSVGDGHEFDCSLAADPRDTDGDGIPDSLEVFGKVVSPEIVATAGVEARSVDATGIDLPNGPEAVFQEHIALPKWGADPRHKDLFIEVDFMMRMPDEASQKLSASVARQFTAYYQDTLDDPHPLVDLYRAVSLLNPDGKRGIHTHLDTGIPPETPEDATTYGDWGGFNAVAPVQNEDGSYKGADPQTAWMDNMSAARRGIFRYILGYPSGGGQNPVSSFAGSGPMNSAWVLAHEFAHAMGLTHSGPPGATGVVDPNCKPNYQSLLNYGFQSSPDVGFSDGLGTPPVNNAALTEWETVSPDNSAYLDVLENTFRYYVDREHGHVDWNRDGEFAPPGTTVRAYANYKPGGGGCEFTRYNQSIIEDAASMQSPAMARLGNRLYVFYSVLGAVYYTYSTDAGNCPEPSTDPCATWSDPEIAYMDAQGGVDVVKIGDAAEARLLVVTIDHEGTIWERRLSVDGSGNESWTDHREIAGEAAPVEGLSTGSAPSLSDLGYCKIFLAYRGADSAVRYNRLTCADGFSAWQGEDYAFDQADLPIYMADFASPGIGRAYLGAPGWATLYGAFAGMDGRLDLYQFDEETFRWVRTSLLDNRPGPVEGRPALEWTSEVTDIDYPGKFYLM